MARRPTAPHLTYADALRRLYREVRTAHGCLACQDYHLDHIRAELPFVCACPCHDALDLLLATRVEAAAPAPPERTRGGRR